jgi:hypothetical protein
MKGDKANYPVSLWPLLAAALIGIALVGSARSDTRGGDVDVVQSNDMNNQTAGDVLGGDLKTGGNKALGLSYGMGDVDINEGKNCMGSEQRANVLFGKQEIVLNVWCASLFYDLNGRHDFAAKMRCDIDEISNKYSSREACWRDQDMKPDQPLGEGSSGVADAIVSHIDETVVQHDEDLEEVREQQAGLVGRIDYLSEQLEQAQRRPPPVVVQQAPPEQYTDDDWDAVWSALKGGDEDE